MLVDHFWDRYYRAVILWCFLPFIVYEIAVIWYISIYGVSGSEGPIEPDQTEIILRYLILILTIYFLYFEIRCLIRDRTDYVLDISNDIDFLALFLNLYILSYSSQGLSKEEEEDLHMRILCCIAVILQWQKSFYWLRLFDNTSFYVRLIVDTLFDIKYFLILFAMILMTFGNAIFILSKDREKSLYRDYVSIDYINVFLNQYEMALGSWDANKYIPGDEGGDSMAWILFIITTMFTQIMFLNMLIAIMGDTFARNTESKAQSALVEKIKILADFVYAVPAESVKNGTLSRFLFAIRPVNLGTDE